MKGGGGGERVGVEVSNLLFSSFLLLFCVGVSLIPYNNSLSSMFC